MTKKQSGRKPHVAVLVPLSQYKVTFITSNGDTFERTVAAGDEVEAAQAVRGYFAFQDLKSIELLGRIWVSSFSYSQKA